MKKVREKAIHVGHCHICGGRINVGDIIVCSFKGVNPIAAHESCHKAEHEFVRAFTPNKYGEYA